MKEFEKEFSIDRLCTNGWKITQGNWIQSPDSLVEVNFHSSASMIRINPEVPFDKMVLLVGEALGHCASARIKKNELSDAKREELISAFGRKLVINVRPSGIYFRCLDRFEIRLTERDCTFFSFSDCRPEDYGKIVYILRDVYSEEEFVFVSPTNMAHV